MSQNKSVKGFLHAFNEMGRGSTVWSLEATETADGVEQGKLYYIKNKDVLTVFNDAAFKDEIWQGEINLVPIPGAQPGMCEAIDCQIGEDPQKWDLMFREEKPAALVFKSSPKLLEP
jgi:hypothetical protein